MNEFYKKLKSFALTVTFFLLVFSFLSLVLYPLMNNSGWIIPFYLNPYFQFPVSFLPLVLGYAFIFWHKRSTTIELDEYKELVGYLQTYPELKPMICDFKSVSIRDYELVNKEYYRLKRTRTQFDRRLRAIKSFRKKHPDLQDIDVDSIDPESLAEVECQIDDYLMKKQALEQSREMKVLERKFNQANPD